jgi:hypothetical protein
MCRSSTFLAVANKEDVDDRVKPDYDEERDAQDAVNGIWYQSLLAAFGGA